MNDLIPPREWNFSGEGDFLAVGKEFLQYFVQFGNLQPYERVLDVGCGIGRMAVPLTGYLNEHGSYEGFDIVPLGVKWCQQHITPRFPNFQFQYADVCNSAYNPDGRIDAEGYLFPYDDNAFDFVFLASVFTHMTAEATENYIAEIARVLKQDGRVFATMFLIDQAAENLIDDGMSNLWFPYRHKNHWIEDIHCEEGIVAQQQTLVEEMLTRYGLVSTGLHYGNWSGREYHDRFEDILVARKAKSVEIPAHLRKQRLRATYHPKNVLRRLFSRRRQPDIDPKTKSRYLPRAA